MTDSKTSLIEEIWAAHNKSAYGYVKTVDLVEIIRNHQPAQGCGEDVVERVQLAIGNKIGELFNTTVDKDNPKADKHLMKASIIIATNLRAISKAAIAAVAEKG